MTFCFFWVARMILMTTYMLNDIPFKTIYLHGLIRTREGKKMSKSEPKTMIDPLESIEKFGADTLRIALILGTGPGQDLRLYPEKMESSWRFVNKIWNAGRYILISIPKETPIMPPKNASSDYARWLLHSLNNLIIYTQNGLNANRLSDVADNLRSFFWGEFCDWYLEMHKNSERSSEDDHILSYAFTTLLKLLHPYLPFVTEKLWGYFDQSKILASSEWPKPQKYNFQKAYSRIEIIKESISQIRALREKAKIAINKKIDATLESEKHEHLFKSHINLIISLAKLESLKINGKESKKNSEDLSSYFKDTLVSIDASLFDLKNEIDMIKKKIKMETDFLSKSQKKLNNVVFLKKAPEKIVSELRGKVISTEKKVFALKKRLMYLEKN